MAWLFMSHPRLSLPSASKLLTACLLVLLFGVGAHTPPPASLTSRINEIIRAEQVRSALWGIYVVDLQSGRTLYQSNASLSMIPASNMKLLTTATAFAVLGPDYQFETTLHHTGTIEAGVLRGDLIIEGSGDPTFGSLKVDRDDPLALWARQLKALGVTRIEGRVIGDDDIFDEKPYAEGWDVSFIGQETWAPPVGGLSYRDNVVDISVEAVQAGRAPVATAVPDGYLQIRNKVETRGSRSYNSLNIQRALGSETVTLEGALRQAYKGTLKLPVSDPTALTLHAFREHLRREDINVDDAAFIDVDDLEAALSYEGAEPLFVHTSPPLHEIAAIINKESNNFYAEQLFRTMAWGGTAESGGKRVKATLEQLGVPVQGLSVQDGSGLSRKDMVTPETMGMLLAKMHQHDARQAFLNSLPSSGERRTTMQYRLADLPVQAKTGSLAYVRALSGYVSTSSGQPVAFAIFANNYSAPSYRIQAAIDAIVHELAAPSDR